MPKDAKHKRSLSNAKSPPTPISAFESSPAFLKIDADVNNNLDDLSTNKSHLIYTGSLISMNPSANQQSTQSPSNNNHKSSVKSRTSSINTVTLGTPQSAGHPRTNSRSYGRFHQLFPSVPINETVIETYSCAYVKSLNLLHGALYLTSNYICFYSKILSSETILIIKLTQINSIVKSMHAVIFPTAIRIETQNSSYLFTSFRSRSSTLESLVTLLKLSRQRQLEQQQQPQQEQQSKMTKNYTEGQLAIKKRPSIEELSQTSSPSLQSFSNVEFVVKSNSSDSSRSDEETPTVDTSAASTTTLTNQQQEKQVNDNNLRNQRVLHHNQAKSSSLFSFSPIIYDIDYSDLSNNKVTVSRRNKKSLLQKVKILLGLLIPGFFKCVLLLLNAFVLLNKVNQVDELFSEILIKQEF